MVLRGPLVEAAHRPCDTQGGHDAGAYSIHRRGYRKRPLVEVVRRHVKPIGSDLTEDVLQFDRIRNGLLREDRELGPQHRLDEIRGRIGQ
jgi:hypothetical protein